MTIELEEQEVTAVPAAEPDAPDELFDPALSRLAAAWEVQAASVDVWTRVEAAIEKERNSFGFAGRRFAEIGEQPHDTAGAKSRPSTSSDFSPLVHSRTRFIDVSRHQPATDALAALPAALAREYFALPLKKEGYQLWVAVPDTPNVAMMDALRRVSRCVVRPMLAEPGALAVAIALAYAEPSAKRDPVQTMLDTLRDRERAFPSLLPPPPPRPPTAVGAPAPAPDDRNDRSDNRETEVETTRLLASAVRTLRDLAHEIADLRAEVAELRRERTRFVPRPMAGRLFPVAAGLRGRAARED